MWHYIVFCLSENHKWFLAPLAKGQRGYCHGCSFVVRGSFNFLAHLSRRLKVSFSGPLLSVFCRLTSVICPSSVNIYLVNTIQATLCIQSSWKFVRMFVLMKSWSGSKMGHIGSKTRSVGQIIEKPCEHSSGHSFSPRLINLAQNGHLDNILVKFEYGSCRVKNKVSRSNDRKTLWTQYRPHYASNHHENLSECLSWWNLSQVRIWVILDQKQGQ